MIIGYAKRDIKENESMTIKYDGKIFSSDDIDITSDGQNHFKYLYGVFWNGKLKMKIENGNLVIAKDE